MSSDKEVDRQQVEHFGKESVIGSQLGESQSSQDVFRSVQEAVQTTGYYTYAEERKLLRKVDLHLMPLLILVYLFKNLDVNNVSYLPTLNLGTGHNILNQLNMTKDDWSWVGTIYFIPFVIFEIPSTMLLKRSTPRVHQFRIAFLWGATTACQAAVRNKEGLYALRFLLGMFEAGLFPSQLTHLTYWYRPDEITTRMAFLGVLGSFSNVLSAFITYGFSFASGHGLSAWQFTFLIEGLLTVVVSFVTLFYLPNFPDSPKWLTAEEKAFISARLPPSSPKVTDANLNWSDIIISLKSKTLFLFSFLRLFQSLGTYGLSFWLPSIIQKFGITSAATAPLMTVPASATSVLSGILFSYSVDRALIKGPYVVLFSLSAALAAFIVLTVVRNSAVLYAFIIIATLAASADGSVLSSWMAKTLEGSTQVGFSMAFANTIGQLGGIVGPQIFRSKYSPRYTVPYAVCLTFIAIGLFTTLVLWWFTKSPVDSDFKERKERLADRSSDRTRKPVYNGSGAVDEIKV